MTISRRVTLMLPVALAAAVFILYLFTLQPSVGFIDAGELSAVAHTFGIAHPTGYPLFTMLAGLWSFLPFGDAIVRLNVFAAFLTAVATGVLVPAIGYLLGVAVVRRPARHGAKPVKRGAKQPASKQSPSTVLSETERLLLSLLGAAVIGCSRTFWSTALGIEVYPLHLLFLALLLWLFPPLVLEDEMNAKTWKMRWLLFAFVLGLSFTNHMTTILLAPGFLVLFIWRFGYRADAWKRIALAVPAFVAGLLPYLYLPLRAASSPMFNWGNPIDWERFIRHVSGKQFQVWIFSGSDVMKKQLGVFTGSLFAEFGYLLLIPAVIGIFALWNRNRKAAVLLVLLFLGCIAYSINYDINDIESYFLLAYLVIGIWSVFGVQWLMDRVAPGTRLRVLAAGALLVGVEIGVGYPDVSQSGNYLVEDYTRNMLQSLKPNALIISFQWDYWVSASYHYQAVEGLRSDVVVIDKELLRRSWYFEQLRTNHPEIYRRSEREISAFLEQLLLFERELPYDGSLIEERYNAMINSFIDANFQDHPIYLTMEMEKQFGPKYTRVPEGLAYRLYKPDSLPSPDEPVWDDFQYRPFKRNERLVNGINGMYADMLAFRAMYLADHAQYDRAMQYLERALYFKPRDPELLRVQAKLDQYRSRV